MKKKKKVWKMYKKLATLSTKLVMNPDAVLQTAIHLYFFAVLTWFNWEKKLSILFNLVNIKHVGNSIEINVICHVTKLVVNPGQRTNRCTLNVLTDT